MPKQLPPTFISERDFELFDPLSDLEKEIPEVVASEKLVRYLFCNHEQTDFMTLDFLKTLFISPNRRYANAFQDALQKMLYKIAFRLQDQNKPLSAELEQHLELLIGIILAAVAYSEPLEGTTLSIPQKINDHWTFLNFQCQHVPMSPSYIASHYIAYWFKPLQKQGHPTILYTGTNPLLFAQGGMMGMMADFWPNTTPGMPLIEYGFPRLQQKITASKKTVYCYGISLGANLAILSHLKDPLKVKAFAYHPPAGLAKDFNAHNTAYNEKLLDIPEDAMTIVLQPYDVVTYLGTHLPHNARVFQVSHEHMGKNLLANHVFSYLGMQQVSIESLPANCMEEKPINQWLTNHADLVKWPIHAFQFGYLASKTIWQQGYFNAIKQYQAEHPQNQTSADESNSASAPVHAKSKTGQHNANTKKKSSKYRG